MQFITSYLLPAALGFLGTAMLTPIYIYFSKGFGIKEKIRDLGMHVHCIKDGTPTAGGVVLITVSIFTAFFLKGVFADSQLTVVASTVLGFALIGLLDDLKKLRSDVTRGFRPLRKLAIQALLSIIAMLLLAQFAFWSGSICLIPFTARVLDLGLLYLPFCLIVLCGTSNAVNLTDGLDGLVTLPVCLCIAVLLAADYFGTSCLSQGTTTLCSAFFGSCLGFLLYNKHPAKIFMGDSGSLALGALIGLISIIGHRELLLAIVGGVFVLEALSVILQVFSFKTFRKRIFKMAPLHHHFEKLGWSENTVVYSFWFISLIFACLGISSMSDSFGV